MRTLQCVSGFCFYIRLTLNALRLQHLSSSHIFPALHCLCLLLILSQFHTQTACDRNSRLLSRHRASSLYLQPVRLLEVSGKFFYCFPCFIQILGSTLEPFSRSLRSTDIWPKGGKKRKKGGGGSLGSPAAQLDTERMTTWQEKRCCCGSSVEGQTRHTVQHS